VVDALTVDGHQAVVVDDFSTGKEEDLNLKAGFYRVASLGLCAILETEIET